MPAPGPSGNGPRTVLCTPSLLIYWQGYEAARFRRHAGGPRHLQGHFVTPARNAEQARDQARRREA